jgi:DNA-binding transcriptional LysR family regulator
MMGIIFPCMNIHHLELFYYVARHGGISQAVRHMPYGVQQPAISSQIIKLEEELGVTLFTRRPFSLTTSGKELYGFVEPFFGKLDATALKLQGGVVHHISIGASATVLQNHLPNIMREVRTLFPALRMTLREGYQPEIRTWLEQQSIDLAFTVIEDDFPPTFTAVPAVRVPLMLILPRKSRIKSAEDLWKQDRISETLIALPASEVMCKQFQAGLAKKKRDWFPSIEVGSLKLVETYVAEGYGIGLFLDVPGNKLPAGVRAIPLPGFTPLDYGLVWQGRAYNADWRLC